jgi:hypothetical protein
MGAARGRPDSPGARAGRGARPRRRGVRALAPRGRAQARDARAGGPRRRSFGRRGVARAGSLRVVVKIWEPPCGRAPGPNVPSATAARG